jgi:hypothetical protein
LREECETLHKKLLIVLCHKEDDQMEHLQYHHFPSRAQEGAEAVVLPAEGRDRIGCFADQVKLTHALVRDLDNAMKRSNSLATLEDHRG